MILKNNKCLNKVSVDDIYKLPFMKMLIGVCTDVIQRRVSQPNTITDDEKYLLDFYDLVESIMKSLECIRISLVISKRYDRKYLMNNQINEEQYTTYCYDSIIHKISTIKDLEFKLIHKLYGLPTKNGKYSWNTIFDHKKVINNDKLFAFYENKSNFDFTSYLVGKRHLSSHEGKLSMRHFKDVSRLLFIRDISNNPLYKEIPSGDYANGFYASLQIKNSRKEAIKYLENVYQICINLRFMFFECLFCDLSNLFTSEIKEHYHKTISDIFNHIISDINIVNEKNNDSE